MLLDYVESDGCSPVASRYQVTTFRPTARSRLVHLRPVRWATLCAEGHVGRPERQGHWRLRGVVVRERLFVGAHLLGSSGRQTDPTTRRGARRAALARRSSTTTASRPEA